jgi:HEAT repeat protein
LCELDVALVDKPGRVPKPGGPRLTVSEKLELALGPFDREKVEATARRLAELLEDPDHAVRRQAIDELAHVEPSISRPHLKAAIRSADPIVAKEAVGAFTKAAGKTAVPVLLEALRSEKCAVRQRIAGALGEVGAGDRPAIEALYPLLRDADWWVRLASVSALRRIGGKEAVPLVEPLLGDPNRHVREAAERTLAALRGQAR